MFGCVEKRLRGNASDIQAGAAKAVPPVDTGHFHAELRGTDGGDIATGPAPITIRSNAVSLIWVSQLDCYPATGREGQTPSTRRRGSSISSLILGKEGHGLAPVDDPVVIGQRQIHHRADHNLVVDHHGALLDLVHAENAGLRRVQDRVDISEP